jgi:peptidyl-prolyl cis-trans isomerase D
MTAMTMLDRMRRHKGWLKWSLALVVLAFVFLYVPGFMDQTGGAALPADVVARVGDQEISLLDFQQVYTRQLQAYRLESGGEISEEVLRSLGIDRQILQQMIDGHAALAEAQRLGLEVSDAEVRERILTFPAFQIDGQFIGEAGYRQLLQQQRPPLSPSQFEEEIRNEILVDRLQAAVTGWVRVSDTEVADEHRRRNERVRLDVVAFRADEFRDEVEATDSDVDLQFAEEAASYEVPEKRRLRFLLVDQTAIFDSLTLTDDEVRQYYDANLSQYQTPGQVRASHILLRAEEDEEDAVAARAAELAAEARAGADFAELAREHSQDEANAENGGDLGSFGRGRMVPEFENAAFELAEGEVSDPVRSPFGFHVIKVTEKQEEVTQAFAEVRGAIENTLRRERSSARATALARAIAAEATTPEELERAASARGYELQESGFAGRGEPILGLGLAQEVSAQAFAIDPGAVAGPIPTPSGPAFVTVTDIQEPYIPELDEVRDQVREDVIRKKSLTLAQARAAEAAETLRAADDFVAAAEEADWSVGSSDLVTRGSALPEIGPNAAVEAVAFAMAPGSVSDVIQAGNAVAVVHLVEREEASAADLAESRTTLRDELMFQRQSRFFTAYMDNVKARLNITIDLAVLEQALGQA